MFHTGSSSIDLIIISLKKKIPALAGLSIGELERQHRILTIFLAQIQVQVPPSYDLEHCRQRLER